MLRTRRVVSAFGVIAAVAALCQFGGAAVAGAQSQAPSQRVIVIFKNQETGLPATRSDVSARRHALQGIQAPVTRQLSSFGARNVHSYTVLNAVSATVSSSQASQLASNPAVSKVIPDQVIQLAPPASTGSGGSQGGLPGSTVCAPNGQVQLNPQALETIHADSDQSPGPRRRARSASPEPASPSGSSRTDSTSTIPTSSAPTGRTCSSTTRTSAARARMPPTGGEEAFGDASSIAAQGREVYNVAGYGPHAVTGVCNIRVEGVAPGASLVGLDIFGAEDAGYNSSFLQAIDYAVATDHVNVLNESLGNNYYPDDEASLDAIKQANDNAVAAGTTVAVSSGDAGDHQHDRHPVDRPATSSRWALPRRTGSTSRTATAGRSSRVSTATSTTTSARSARAASSRTAARSTQSRRASSTGRCARPTLRCTSDCVSYAGNPTPVIPFGGTSESSPLTAGEAALVIQAYRKGHGGASPTPAVVKQIIVSTTDDIGSPADQQGAGLIDAYKAVQAAESYRTSTFATKPAGNTLLTSPTQLNAIGQSGQRRAADRHGHEQRVEHADDRGLDTQDRGLHGRSARARSCSTTRAARRRPTGPARRRTTSRSRSRFPRARID